MALLLSNPGNAMASQTCHCARSLTTLLVLAAVAGAAFWVFTLGPSTPGAQPSSNSPLTAGHTLWDSFPETTERPTTQPALPEAAEAEVLLENWQYSAIPVSHWRR